MLLSRFVFLWLILLSQNLAASTVCAHLYSRIIVDQTPLDDLLKTHLQTSPYAKLKFVKNQGEGITFHFLRQPTKEQNISGESIQAKSLEHTLRQWFPKAKFTEIDNGELRSMKPTKTDIPVAVHDLEEDRLFLGDRVVFDIMPLKMTNLSLPKANRSELREAMGVGANGKMVHVYSGVVPSMADDFVTYRKEFRNIRNEVDNIVGLLLDLGDQSNVDTVALSIKNIPDLDTFMAHPELKSKFVFKKYSDILDSKISAAPNKNDKRKVLILNDTKGHMPEVNLASDLTVVWGPQNIFESLNAGTPTLSIDWENMGKSYDRVMEIAGQSNAFKAIQTKSGQDYILPINELLKKDRVPFELRPAAKSVPIMTDSVFKTLKILSPELF